MSKPDPSASMTTRSLTPASRAHAPMTNASLTAMQTILSTPLALIASAFSRNPGRCRALQVGVNAPGVANNTTFFPLKMSSVDTSFGPSGVAVITFMDGIVSPTLMAIAIRSLFRDWRDT